MGCHRQPRREQKRPAEYKNVMGHVYGDLSSRQLAVCCVRSLTFNRCTQGVALCCHSTVGGSAESSCFCSGTLSVTQIAERWLVGRILTSVGGSDRGLTSGTVLAFSWRD
jgi:hypothetical protein